MDLSVLSLVIVGLVVIAPVVLGVVYLGWRSPRRVPSRWLLCAAVVLTMVGGSLLVVALIQLVRVLPLLLGSEGEHMAGDAMLWVIVVAIPHAVGGSLALGAAWLLRRGSPGGAALAGAWVGLAGLASVVLWQSTGNLVGALRMLLFEADGGWSFHWPTLIVSGYSFYLDDVLFWTPGIVAVGALVVGVLLLGALFTGRYSAGRPTGTT